MKEELLIRIYSEKILFFWIGGVFLFLSIYELITVMVNKKMRKIDPGQIILLYMFLRGGRLLIFAFVVIIYSSMIKTKIISFVWTIVALYLIYLLRDAFLLISTGKRKEKEKYD